MKKVSKLNLSKQSVKTILEELWEDSVFNNSSYSVLEKLAVLSHKEDIDGDKLPEESFFGLSTSRNRHLITYEQQRILQKTVVAFFGLSVGSHAAITWMIESRADAVKIVDPDIVSPTNLNRLRAGWGDVGEEKVNVVTNDLKKVNPFADIISHISKDEDSVRKLFDQDPKINIVVDAIDDMKGKIFLRKLAKERKLPLISAADVGDNITLDIERYDENPQPEMFLGRINNMDKIDFSKLSDLERRRLIIKLVGFEKNSEAMLDSLLGIGDTLGTWPQLGATATIAGGVVATAIKKVVLGEKVKSGRYYICLDDILVQGFNSLERKNLRREKVKRIRKKFNI